MKFRWKAFALAFAMAVALWYGVSGSEKVESILEVRVDYRGLPNGYIVRSGLVNKIEVRVRAPVGSVRTLADRNPIFYMDLSSVTKGENVVQIDSSQLPFRRNVEVIDITPSSINLDVDVSEQKKIPLAAEISGKLKKDLIAQVTFSPAEVTLSGPSEALEKISIVSMDVAVDENTPPGNMRSMRKVIVPEGVDADPPEVSQILSVGVKRKLVSVTRDVRVETPSSTGSFTRPDKVTIQVAVPLSMADKVTSNSSIRAFAQLGSYELGSHNLPVLVELPEGAELVKVEPEHITVTLEQKKPQAKPAGKRK